MRRQVRKRVGHSKAAGVIHFAWKIADPFGYSCSIERWDFLRCLQSRCLAKSFS